MYYVWIIRCILCTFSVSFIIASSRFTLLPSSRKAAAAPRVALHIARGHRTPRSRRDGEQVRPFGALSPLATTDCPTAGGRMQASIVHDIRTHMHGRQTIHIWVSWNKHTMLWCILPTCRVVSVQVDYNKYRVYIYIINIQNECFSYYEHYTEEYQIYIYSVILL